MLPINYHKFLPGNILDKIHLTRGGLDDIPYCYYKYKKQLNYLHRIIRLISNTISVDVSIFYILYLINRRLQIGKYSLFKYHSILFNHCNCECTFPSEVCNVCPLNKTYYDYSHDNELIKSIMLTRHMEMTELFKDCDNNYIPPNVFTYNLDDIDVDVLSKSISFYCDTIRCGAICNMYASINLCRGIISLARRGAPIPKLPTKKSIISGGFKNKSIQDLVIDFANMIFLDVIEELAKESLKRSNFPQLTVGDHIAHSDILSILVGQDCATIVKLMSSEIAERSTIMFYNVLLSVIDNM